MFTLKDCNYFFYLREVLKDDSGGAEGNLSVVLRGLLPVQDGLNVLLLDGEIVAVANGALKEDSDGVGQGRCNEKLAQLAGVFVL